VATNLVTTQASLAFGSVVWGVVASTSGTPIALSLSAVVMVLLYLLSRRVRVELGNEADVTMGVAPPELSIPVEPMPDDGPVLIQIEYRVDPENRKPFLRAIEAIEHIRRRNGAASWRVYRDLEDEERFVERFVLTSWAEYTRQRSRMTVKDRELQDRVVRLNQSGVPIRVSRLIGIDASEAHRT